MENLLQRLEEISVKVETLKSDHRELLNGKLRLNEVVSTLKVENEIYKQEIETLKQELEALKECKDVRTSGELSLSDAVAANTESSELNKQLHECIEEIDQCIHIIKTGQHVGK
jgi:hypothetical protein